MITRALFVRLEAKPGREDEVESFLHAALTRARRTSRATWRAA
jgi:hypothetical protein